MKEQKKLCLLSEKIRSNLKNETISFIFQRKFERSIQENV